MGGLINPVLTRSGCIKCYISLFKEIILQQLDVFQTEIKGSLTKLCAFKASWGHPSKVVKLPIVSPGAENMEYLNNPRLHNKLHLCCVINVQMWFPRDFGITGFNHCVPLIRITCPCNIYPLTPHFYIVKLGFTGVYIFVLIFALKHRLWVLVRAASLRRF